MKKSYVLYALLFIAVIIIPVLLYTIHFSYSFSGRNEDWSFFGSYIGGVYSSIFGFISIVILAFTLIETQKNNKTQLESIKKEQLINELVLLVNSLKQRMNENYYLNLGNDGYYLRWLLKNMIGKAKKIMPTEEFEIWDGAIEYMKESEGILDDEIIILREILFRLASNDDEQLKNTVKIFIKGVLGNDERFWLETYGRAHDFSVKKYLKDWTDFSLLPKALADLVPEKEDLPDSWG